MSRCSEMNETFPCMLPGMVGGEGERQIRYDIPPSDSGALPGEKRRLIQGGWSARISNRTRPQDPGGGEAQLTSSRDMAVARPVFQPTSQPVILRSDEVGVSAVSVDATRRRVDRTVSTVSDSVMVVTEELQWDSWTRSGNDLPQRGESAVSVDSAVSLVGGLASAFLSGADGCADFAGEVAVVVTSPAVFAGDVAVGVTSPDLADLAEVVAVDVTLSAVVGLVTVGVTDLADARTASLVDAGAVSLADARVASLADARAASLADAGAASLADPAGNLASGVMDLNVPAPVETDELPWLQGCVV